MTDPIDPRLVGAIRRDREAAAPEEARAHVAARLAPFLPGQELPPRGAARAAAGGAHSTGLIALAFVVGGGVGALLHAALASSPAARLVYMDRPVGSASSVATALSPPQPSASGTGNSAGAPASPLQATESRTATRVGTPQLDAERALLDAARALLVSGETGPALDALDRHSRAFPRPMLGEEREALFVQALVRAGRYEEARTRADAFRRHAPSSLFLAAVDSAIASIP
jgi:hypothetical protein